MAQQHLYAAITEDEKRALKRLAFDLRRPLQDIIAEVLRKSPVTAKAMKSA